MQNLIVFAKRPIPGNVKTRISQTSGAEEALSIYLTLLSKTVRTASEWMDKNPYKRRVHWFWDIEKYPRDVPIGNPGRKFYVPGDFEEYIQYQSRDLGDRMAYAFEELFNWMDSDDYYSGRDDLWDEDEGEEFTESGGNGCVMIGTDCPYLKVETIEEAFNILAKEEIVIGSATDGGYYLLGMSDYYPDLFNDVEWSTAHVLQKTLENAEELGVNVERLEHLSDIDTMDDWKKYKDSLESKEL